MIRVIGAGFGRTGTTSLKLALEYLGFGPCYHFTELVKSGHLSDWMCIARGGEPNWDQLFRGYTSTTDWPAASYFEELSVHYPDALVILTTRDPVAWHDSVCQSLYPLRKAIVPWLPLGRSLAELTDRIIWQGTFAGRVRERDHAIKVFEQHRDRVRSCIAPGRLLEFDVKQGWKPLCEFLSVPVPDIPFPHANDAVLMHRYVLMLRILRYLLPISVAIGVIWGGVALL